MESVEVAFIHESLVTASFTSSVESDMGWFSCWALAILTAMLGVLGLQYNSFILLRSPCYSGMSSPFSVKPFTRVPPLDILLTCCATL